MSKTIETASILDKSRALTDRLLDKSRALTDRLLDKSRALTDRRNERQRGDAAPGQRVMVAGDEYGRDLTIRPSGNAYYPWALVIRPTIGAAHVSLHASIEAAQRRAAEHLGRSRLMAGWTWIAVAPAP